MKYDSLYLEVGFIWWYDKSEQKPLWVCVMNVIE